MHRQKLKVYMELEVRWQSETPGTVSELIAASSSEE